MKRLFRWLLRILVALVIAGLVFYIVVLPGIVERVAVSTLEGMGLEDVRLEVRGLSLRHAQLANVAAGEGERLFVGAIGLRYTLRDLLRGRVDVVELTGVEVDVRIRDGQIDLGPLAELLDEESSGEEFLAGRVELRSSTLLVDFEGSRLRLPLRGTVVDKGKGKVGVSARVGRERLDLRATGTLDTNSMAADLDVRGNLWEMETLADALLSRRESPADDGVFLRRFPGPQLQVGGDMTVDMTCRRQADTTQVALRATVVDAQLGRRKQEPFAAADSVQIELDATLDGSDVSAVRAVVEADAIAPAGLDPIPSASATLTWDGREASLSAEFGDPFWQCLKLSARVAGLLPWLRRESDALVTDVSWEMTTVLGDSLWERIPGLPVGLPLPDTISLEGDATARIDRGEGGTLSWHVEAPDVLLELQDDYFGPESLSAELRLALETDAQEAKVRVLPDSRMVYHRPSLALGVAELSFSDASRHALKVNIGGEGILAAVRFGETLDWRVSVSQVDVKVAGGQVRVSGATVSDLAATARVSLEATPNEAKVTLRQGSKLSAGPVRLDDGWTVAPNTNDASLIEARVADAGASLSVRLPNSDWTLSAPGVTVSIPEAIATCTEPRAEAGGLSLAAKLDVEADPDRLKATLQPGAQLVLKSLATDLVRIECEESEPLLSLTTTGDPATLGASLAKQTLEWTARLPRIAVALAAKGASLPDGPSIEGPSLQLNVAAEATNEKVTLKGLPGSHLSLAGATLALGGEALRLDAARFALTMDPANALAELLLGEPFPTVRVAARTQSANPVKTALGTRANATVREVEIGLEGSSDGRTADVKAVLQLRGADASAKHVVDKETLDVALRDWSAEAVVSGKGPVDALPLEATVTLESGKSPKALTASMGALAASLAQAQLKGEVALLPGRDPRGSATLTVTGGEASHKDAGLSIKGIAATVPLLLGENPRAHGTFAVESIHVADADLPGLKGTFESADRQSHVKGKWPIIPGATLSFDTALDFRLPLPRGELTATLPRFAFDDSNQPSALFGVLEGVEVGGAMSLDARVRLAQGLLDPLVTLRLEDVSIASEAYDASLEGISTELTFNRLRPLATPGSQRIRVSRGHVGKLHVRDGAIAFRLEDIDSLFVEQLEWGWAGGRIYTHALRLNPFDPKPDLVLYAERLELSELLALVAEGEVTGTGSLYGRLPVAIDWPKVSYGRGFLYATPGRGRLKFNRATLDSILSLGHPSLNKVAARSLEEFEYSEFQADFMGEDPDKLARVRAFGKSLSAKHPWEWLLDVRVHGFDRLLNQAIIIKRGADELAGSLETLK
jgi:hypothetical protein